MTTAPLPMCSASTYCSWPRREKVVADVHAGVAVAPTVGEGEVAGVAMETVGSGSFAVVRMKSGDPRYHPMARRRSAATRAAARTVRERGTHEVSG